MYARVSTIPALAIPSLVGLTYLLLAGAPRSYLLVNATALLLSIALMAFGKPRVKRQHRLPILVVAVGLLFVPLFTGVAVNGIARWLPIGPVLLHAGLLVLPAISVLAAEGKAPGKIALVAALVAVFLQPDAGTGLAITGAAIGLYVARPHWATGCIAFAAFLASLSMLVRGELPAQPYVERILVDAAQVSLWLAVGILVALLGTVALLAGLRSGTVSQRFALAGSFAGFSIAALVSNYPFPLIGYGASAILGYGLALFLMGSSR